MNINKRLIIIIFSTTIITGFLIFLTVYHIFSQALEERFKERIKLTAKHFAAGASIGIVFKDTSMIEKLAAPILKDEEIEGIEVKNSKGNPLFFKGKRSKYAIEIPIATGESEESILFNPAKENILGKVIVFYNKKKLEEILKETLAKIFILSLLISGIFSFAAYTLISKAIYAPLKELLAAVKKVEEGDLEVKISGGNLPETKTLALAFSNMVEALKRHQKILEETYKEMAQNLSLAEIGKFSLTVAHEIKNPLGIIKGSLDILKKENIDKETKEQMLSFIEEETKRIDRLIKEFLQLSRPDNVHIKTINVKDLFLSIQEKLKIRYPDKKIIFEGPETKISTDPHLLEKIIINLIQNSFEAKADKVEVTLSHSDSSYEITIKDNGKGISREEMENIFKPFYTTKKGGSGLGLSIVLQSVYALRGKISVYSEINKGTTFKLTFPLMEDGLG